jgi:hypothetical protein
VAFALIDPDFAKDQLLLMTREWYMHPNGQIPAYEWAFGDVNPPVPRMGSRPRLSDRAEDVRTQGPRFPRAYFPQADAELHVVGQPQRILKATTSSKADFLGLDNIGVFDRSVGLPLAASSTRQTGRAGWRLTA